MLDRLLQVIGTMRGFAHEDNKKASRSAELSFVVVLTD